MPPILDALSRDTRQSVRRLCRSSGFSLAVVVTLALVIGAITTAFSLLNATSLRTVSASDPDRLVAISTVDTRTNQPGFFSFEAFEAFRAQQQSFSKLSMYSGGGVFRVDAEGGGVDAVVEGVMPAYYDMLSPRLVAGRFPGEHDAEAVVISERLWHRLFNADPAAIGATIKVDGRSVAVVGVIAAGFSGLQQDAGVDLFVPLAFARALVNDPKGRLRAPTVVGQLAVGVSFDEARTEVLARWPAITAATLPSVPAANQATVQAQRVAVEPLATGFSSMRRQWGTSFSVLLGLSAMLLGIGCVNLMGLTSARTLARRTEIAVCLALGASRARLFQQLLVESLLLAVAGLVIAIPFAWWATDMLTATLSVTRTVPLQRPLTPDVRVVAVAGGIAIVVGLLIGMLPAWRAINTPPVDAMRQGRTVARASKRTSRFILVTQVALSMVLLIGAGLFVSMLSSLHLNESSFRGRNIVWTRLSRNPGDREPLGQSYFRGLIEELSRIPGVDGAVLSVYFPAYLGFRGALPADQFASDAGLAITGMTEFVTPGFFRTFGIHQSRGRDFTWQDDGSAPQVTIISETLARKLYPDGTAVGRRMRTTSGSTSVDVEIVGVVADAPIGSIREPNLAVSFRPMMQNLARAQFPMTHVRVVGDIATVRDAYVRVVEKQGHHFVRMLFTLDDWFDNALLQERLIAAVSTSAAMLAMLLACIGIYGLLAYAVTLRVREIGVRMSLGATRVSVLRMVMRDGLTVVVPGVLAGIPCALAAATLIRSQLYGVSPSDPSTIASASILFVGVTVAAALVPAWRASTVEPVHALRQEGE